MRSSVFLLSKRARSKAASSSPGSTAPAAGPASSDGDLSGDVAKIANPEPQQLLLFFCDKQFQARLIPMAAATQLLLAVAHSDSLYMVKSRLAEQDRVRLRKQRKQVSKEKKIDSAIEGGYVFFGFGYACFS